MGFSARFDYDQLIRQQLHLYGHRGARGLSPENTLPAYRTALAIGVHYVDMDVGMTQDGVVVGNR